MVRAFAVIANGGVLVEPTLIRKVVKRDAQGSERVLLDNTLDARRERFKRVMPKEITKEVVRAMKYTTKLGGTGRLAEVGGYSEAGKTGTAEKIIGGAYSKNKHISSFIGFVPAHLDDSHPTRFVLLISIDEPAHIILEGGYKAYYGGGCAAPIFKEIATRTLEYLGTPLDDPHGYPPGDPRHDPSQADWAKEVKELKTLFESWNHK
jgi:cell division protein FtsI (penicillin-binding protein 3)